MANLAPVTYELKNGLRITIRSALETDASQLMDCIRACVQDGEGLTTQLAELPENEDEFGERIMEMLTQPSWVQLVVEHQGKLIGSLDFRTGQRKCLAHTGDFAMAILPQYRALGAGTVLLRTFIRWAKATQGIEKIHLFVLSRNRRARRLYRKLGFKKEGRMRRAVKHPDGKYDDDILMARFVKPKRKLAIQGK